MCALHQDLSLSLSPFILKFALELLKEKNWLTSIFCCCFSFRSVDLYSKMLSFLSKMILFFYRPLLWQKKAFIKTVCCSVFGTFAAFQNFWIDSVNRCRLKDLNALLQFDIRTNSPSRSRKGIPWIVFSGWYSLDTPSSNLSEVFPNLCTRNLYKFGKFFAGSNSKSWFGEFVFFKFFEPADSWCFLKSSTTYLWTVLAVWASNLRAS